MNTIADQSSIDPGAVVPLLIAAALALVVTLAVIAWRDAGRRIDDALPVLLDTTVPLRERCAVLTCTERGTVTYGDFTVCRGHDPLGPVEEL